MLVKYSGSKCDCCDYRDDEVRFEDRDEGECQKCDGLGYVDILIYND
jgi:hypothetical protein